MDELQITDYGMTRFRKGEMYGLLSPAGRMIIPAAYDHFTVGERLIITFRNGSLGLYGANGIQYLDAVYDDIFQKMYDLVLFEKDGKMGYLNLRSGKATLAEWDEITLMEHYYNAGDPGREASYDIVVSRNGKKGLYLMKNDSLILPAIYNAFEDLIQGCIVYWKKDSCGLITSEGKHILTPSYNDIFYIGDQYLKVRVGKKHGLFDLRGRMLIAPKYDDLVFLQADQAGRGLLKYVTGNYWGLVRSDSTELTEAKYSNIEIRQGGFLVSVINEQYGTIALDGSTILEPQFDHIRNAVDNLYVTHKNMKVGLLNYKGQQLVEPVQDKITVVNNTIKAYKGDILDIMWIDGSGNITDQVAYEGIPSVHLEERDARVFQWSQPSGTGNTPKEFKFYFSEEDGKWGLKEIPGNRVIISPRYDRIMRYPDQWFTYVYVNTDTTHYEIAGCKFYSLQACGTGSALASGPAYDTFRRYVDFSGVNIQGNNKDAVAGHIISGLNPSCRYSFKGTSNRGESNYTNRWTLFELLGADSFRNAHSAGCLTNAPAQGINLDSNQVAICTGMNTFTGAMFDWEDVHPGDDGQIVIISRKYSGPVPNGSNNLTAYTYYLAGLRLEQLYQLIAITNQMQDITIVPGRLLTLSVGVRGSGPLFYHWRKNGINILNATNSTYTISSTATNDSGYYSVIVSNAYSSDVSSEALLTVGLYPPLSSLNPPAWSSL